MSAILLEVFLNFFSIFCFQCHETVVYYSLWTGGDARTRILTRSFLRKRSKAVLSSRLQCLNSGGFVGLVIDPCVWVRSGVLKATRWTGRPVVRVLLEAWNTGHRLRAARGGGALRLGLGLRKRIWRGAGVVFLGATVAGGHGAVVEVNAEA